MERSIVAREHMSRSTMRIRLLVTTDVVALHIVLYNLTVLRQKLVDSGFDVLEQGSIGQNLAGKQYLKVPLDFFQQLLGRFALPTEDGCSNVDEPPGSARRLYGVSFRKEVLQLLTRFVTALDIFAHCNPGFLVNLIFVELSFGAFEEFFQGRQRLGYFSEFLWNAGFVFDCVVNLDRRVDYSDGAGDEAVDAQYRFDSSHGFQAWWWCFALFVWLVGSRGERR